MHIEIARVRVAKKATANGLLLVISEEPADVAKDMNRTSSKIKPSSTGFGDHVEMEVIEDIVPIEVEPPEFNL